MNLENTKIFTKNRNECRIFQEIVLELGGFWGGKWKENNRRVEVDSHNTSVFPENFRAALFVGYEHNFTYRNKRDVHFNTHTNREVKLIPDTKLARKLYKKIIAEKEGYLLINA